MKEGEEDEGGRGGLNREDIRTVRERGGDGDRERRGEQRGGVCCDQVHTVWAEPQSRATTCQIDYAHVMFPYKSGFGLP